MEEPTQDLISELKKCKNMDEVINKVTETQGDLKSRLQDKGYRFYDIDSSLPEEFGGGQNFRGKEDVGLARSYQEINYIKTGLSSGWVTDIDETKRFETIKNEVNNTIEDKI